MVFKSSDDKRFLLDSFEKNLDGPNSMAGTGGDKKSDYAMENAAFETIRSHMAALDGQNTDLVFLKSMMESPVMSRLIKVQDTLEDQSLAPISAGNLSLASEICQRFDRSYRRDAKELTSILRNSNFRALLDAHDTVAGDYTPEKGISKEKAPWEEKPDKMRRGDRTTTTTTRTTVDFDIEGETEGVIYGEPIRMVGLRKTPGQPLGVTLEEVDKNLVVARILSGGMIDRLGLLKVGDVVLEVNSVKVTTPQQVMNEIAKARDSLQLKVGSPAPDKVAKSSREVQLEGSNQRFRKLMPSTYEGQRTLCFMRALFTYDPTNDSLQPCKEIGLGFTTGDILQIVDQSDPNWWQAKKIGENVVGIIPSRELEEKRAAFVRPEADFVHSIGICGTRISRKKKKCAYDTKQNAVFDKAELSLYEEVTRMPPFRRKTLILVGTSGVGRRTLKTRLMNFDSNRFGAIIPLTSRAPREGEEQTNTYIFVTREEFEEGIRDNRFLEFGEYANEYYGTTYDSVRTVIRQGKMCIIDCNPRALKFLHTSAEFMPYVVFLSAPGADRVHAQDEFARSHGYSSRTLAFERLNSIRYSSRRARTLESIASLYEEEDVRTTVEESQRLQRLYSAYFDLVVVNEDFDTTFRRVTQALDALSTDHQWVPMNWVLER